ncbi:MAG: flagellar biosynthesis protein FlhB [Amphiplicatus sp.]
MADEGDDFQRTEEPTPKRLEEARKKGDAPKSQEVVAALMLAAGALVLWLFAGPAARSLAAAGAAFLDHPHDFAIDGAALQRLFSAVSLRLGSALAGAGLVILAAAILANAGQARPVFTTARIAPKLSKLSPVAGAKRIFGPSGFFNFTKGAAKISIVGAILVYALWPDRALLVGLIAAGEKELVSLARAETLKLLILTVSAMGVIAALDYGYQRHAWTKRLRMTKEEVRRELKETEGDPVIRGRLRQMRESRARRRMIAAVKDATVLVMNPTHYAVALKYELGVATAPVCVAKGADEVALRMREAAEEHRVPVVENAPLARALFAGAEIDEEIPVEQYEAVAAVISVILNRDPGRGAGLGSSGG